MDSSPVTVGDFSVQAIVLYILNRYFPGYGFIAEETSAVLRQDPVSLAAVLEVVRKALDPELTEAELCAAIDLGGRGHGNLARERPERGGRTWVLDPIDGTKGFLRGEQFCVALVRGGRIFWAVAREAAAEIHGAFRDVIDFRSALKLALTRCFY